MTRTNAHGQPIGDAIDGWSPRPLPPRTAMQGRFCCVEPVNPAAHEADLFAAYMLAPDGRDWTYLGVERPETLADFGAYLAKAAASADPMHHAVVDLATGKAVGTASFMRIDPPNGAIEVGAITWSPLLQRKPASTEAMYLMMRRAFDELGYRRYEWKCDSHNAPSRAAALRYGFQYEGLFRQAVVIKGRNRDTTWFSITDKEWPVVRAGFEAWLAPGNFDAAGNQRCALADCRG